MSDEVKFRGLVSIEKIESIDKINIAALSKEEVQALQQNISKGKVFYSRLILADGRSKYLFISESILLNAINVAAEMQEVNFRANNLLDEIDSITFNEGKEK